MDLLTVEHVTKQYAGHKALDDVSLAIPKGSVYGLLGPNGARLRSCDVRRPRNFA